MANPTRLGNDTPRWRDGLDSSSATPAVLGRLGEIQIFKDFPDVFDFLIVFNLNQESGFLWNPDF